MRRRKSMRDCWHSMFSDTAPAKLAASGCAPPMPPRPAVRIQRPGEVAAVVLAAGLDEGLVGALHDALAADVDPRAGGHLAVHHQALAVELVEVLPRRPLRHQVRVGDQHARRIDVRAEHADRLARLHQQRLVVLRARAGVEDAPRSSPSCAPPCRCRRRRPARRGSRPPRDRGCSGSSGRRPRSASCGRSARVPRGARTVCGRASWRWVDRSVMGRLVRVRKECLDSSCLDKHRQAAAVQGFPAGSPRAGVLV